MRNRRGRKEEEPRTGPEPSGPGAADPAASGAPTPHRIAGAVARSLAMVAVGLLASWGALAGQESDPGGGGAPEEGAGEEESETINPRGTPPVEIGIFNGLMNDVPNFRPDGIRDQVRRDAVIGVRATHRVRTDAFVEAAVANSLMRLSLPGMQHQNVNGFLISAAMGYNVQPTDEAQLFVAAGPGVVHWRLSDLGSETQLVVNYGVGGRLFVASRLAVRADARMHQVPNGFRDTRAAVTGGATDGESLFALELSTGLSYFPRSLRR